MSTGSVKAVIRKCDDTHQLVMLNSSDRFLKRLAQATVAKRKSAEKMLKRAADLDEQMHAQLERCEKVEMPKLEALQARTKFLKLEIERVLSSQFKRPVNIQGSFIW
jgi:hypothetical protein